MISTIVFARAVMGKNCNGNELSFITTVLEGEKMVHAEETSRKMQNLETRWTTYQEIEVISKVNRSGR